MIWKRPFSSLSKGPHEGKNKHFHLALGLFCLIFFLQFPIIFPQLSLVSAQQPTTQPTAANTTTPAVPTPIFQSPHPGYITTPFSFYHPGIDICTGLGMPIKPLTGGTIVEAGYSFWGLGLFVEVDHGNGYRSLYAHMGKIFVEKGKVVGANDILGEVGLTGNTSGPHTHLEVTKDGSKVDPRPLLPEIRNYPKEEDFQVIQSSTPSAILAPTFIATPSAAFNMPVSSTSAQITPVSDEATTKTKKPEATQSAKPSLQIPTTPEEKFNQFLNVTPKPTVSPKPQPKGGLLSMSFLKTLTGNKK